MWNGKVMTFNYDYNNWTDQKDSINEWAFSRTELFRGKSDSLIRSI